MSYLISLKVRGLWLHCSPLGSSHVMVHVKTDNKNVCISKFEKKFQKKSPDFLEEEGGDGKIMTNENHRRIHQLSCLKCITEPWSNVSNSQQCLENSVSLASLGRTMLASNSILCLCCATLQRQEKELAGFGGGGFTHCCEKCMICCQQSSHFQTYKNSFNFLCVCGCVCLFKSCPMCLCSDASDSITVNVLLSASMMS